MWIRQTKETSDRQRWDFLTNFGDPKKYEEMSDLHLRLLDAFARRPLWQDGMEYGHGTGHGIGAYLNVHEGPAQSHGDRIIGFQG